MRTQQQGTCEPERCRYKHAVQVFQSIKHFQCHASSSLPCVLAFSFFTMTARDQRSQMELHARKSDMKVPEVSMGVEVDGQHDLARNEMNTPKGINRVEAMRLVWGKHGLKVMWISIAMALTV